MNRFYRTILIVSAAILFIVAVGFFLQIPFATRMWPLESGRLSNIFIASIVAAVAAPILWIGLSGETRAIAGGAINLNVTSAGFTVFAFQLYAHDRQPGLQVLGLTSIGMLLVTGALFVISSRYPFRDTRPTPGLVRAAFGAFALLLALTGGMLALQRPNVFPWPLSPENSTFYGWIFLGAMLYFLYGLIYPYWGNARGQLLGFLAYDLVLIGPFLAHFASVQPEMRTSLIVYTTVVTLSGLLAAYFLFVHPATRFGSAREASAPLSPRSQL